jgi:putative component of membrane protein insertase Oxa1/YidC/SpoIIIJ protein YidD
MRGGGGSARAAATATRIAIATAMSLAFARAATAQARDPAFEPIAKHAALPAGDATEPSGFSPAADLFLPLIHLYQGRIGPNSIHRCPFVVSCSNFAKIGIERYGIFGLFLFLDRYLYRENPEMREHYPTVRADDGRLLLDDGAFR